MMELLNQADLSRAGLNKSSYGDQTLLMRLIQSSIKAIAFLAASTYWIGQFHTFAVQSEAVTPIFPKALLRGDTIMFVAPSSPASKPQVVRAQQRLTEMGFKVRVPTDLFRKHRYFAGTDDERAAALMAAFTDHTVAAVFPCTGGYGATRILDRLDYNLIRCNPKILIGFSDITALHVAINQRTGLVTFHSPNPEWGLGSDENLTPFAEKWFWRALSGRTNPRQVGYTILTNRRAINISDAAELHTEALSTKTLRCGLACGRMIGGNLSVVHAMMGTPFEIQTDGKILFLEDIGEAPYRIDRMLQTLAAAGKFKHLAGVVLGTFSPREGDKPWEGDVSVADVLEEYFIHLGVPVLMDFPAGHLTENCTLPMGAMTELDATRGTIRLLEEPVQFIGDRNH